MITRLFAAGALALAAACSGGSGDAECRGPLDDGDPCTVDACDPSSGEVTHAAKATDDGDACTADACDPATGAVTHASACDDANACTADSCDAGGGCGHEALDATARAILAGAHTGLVRTSPIATYSQGDVTVCPGGHDPSADPPRCELELDYENAALDFQPESARAFRIAGTVPARVRNLPVRIVIAGIPGTGSVVLVGNGGCPGETQTFASIPVDIGMDVGTVAGAKLVLTATADQPAIGAAIGACGAMAPYVDFVRGIAAAQLAGIAEQLLRAQVEDQLCLRGPDCPGDTAAGPDGLCRYGTGECAARGVEASTGALIVPACAE